ncbi:hypothetical protein Tco_1338489 [Tanacetum coccineum]
MADTRTMAQLLEAPTEGYEEAIVVPEITANNFEIKHELHQLDTFYNALNANDQDSLNSAAGGNFLDKMPRECLKIIESKSRVRQSRSKAVVAKKNQSSATPAAAPASVKAVEQSCVTCGGAHAYQNCPATNSPFNMSNIKSMCHKAAAVNFNPGMLKFSPSEVDYHKSTSWILRS